MNWGKWIMVAFVLFAIFIATLVTVCVRQDVLLVSKAYYKDELAYQEQIDRMENANALPEKPEILVQNGELRVMYDRFPEIENGVIRLFRPSDERLDQQFTLQPSGLTQQQFKITNPKRGLYRARMQWEQAGKEYFIEKVIVL